MDNSIILFKKYRIVDKMKKIAFYFLIIFSLGSCGPIDRRIPGGSYVDFVKINAKVVNPRDSIGINDTVRIQLEVPDTINYNGQPTSLFLSE